MQAVTIERIRRIEEKPTLDPSENLAREERYLQQVMTPSFRVWRNARCVVLGRFLDPGAEVFSMRALDLGVPVLRRRSGGGAVYHDPGNINYSIYLPDAGTLCAGVKSTLVALSFPVTSLLDHLGAEWTWEPPNNVFVSGRKVSGSAEWRHRGKLLHHGTLLVDSDLDTMWELLKPGGRSAIAPVANLRDTTHWLTAERASELLTEELERH